MQWKHLLHQLKELWVYHRICLIANISVFLFKCDCKTELIIDYFNTSRESVHNTKIQNQLLLFFILISYLHILPVNTCLDESLLYKINITIQLIELSSFF